MAYEDLHHYIKVLEEKNFHIQGLHIFFPKRWSNEGHTREWPNDIEMSEEIKDQVTRRWSEYDI